MAPLKFINVKYFKIITCFLIFIASSSCGSNRELGSLEIETVKLNHPDWSLVFNDNFSQIGLISHEIKCDEVIVILYGCDVGLKIPFSYRCMKVKSEFYLEYSEVDYWKLKGCRDLKIEIYRLSNDDGVMNI